MLVCMPTRLRIATDSHPALAPLCLESAPHSSQTTIQPLDQLRNRIAQPCQTMTHSCIP